MSKSRARSKPQRPTTRPNGRYRINVTRLPHGLWNATATRTGDGRCVAVSVRGQKRQALAAVKQTCRVLANTGRQAAEEDFYRFWRPRGLPQVTVV